MSSKKKKIYDEVLNDNGFDVIAPPSRITKITVFVRNVDELLVEISENDLAVKLMRCNPRIKVSKVTNFHKGFHIEVECEEMGMGNECLE